MHLKSLLRTFVVLQGGKPESGKGTDDSEDENEPSIYEIACSRVAGDAIRKGSSDNVTVMLVEIQSA